MREIKKILPLFAPFLLTAFVIIVDQAVKSFIVNNLPLSPSERDIRVFDNDLLWIIHVRNKAIAFSLGHSLPDAARPVLFIILPLAVLAGVIVYYFKTKDFSLLQRWAVAGIIGGGLGNIIDRIFRPDGVVDFISVKFFVIWDRWPTFNIADASVVICCFIFLISIFGDRKGDNA